MMIAVLNAAYIVTDILNEEEALRSDPKPDDRWVDVTLQPCAVGAIFDPGSGSFEGSSGWAGVAR